MTVVRICQAAGCGQDISDRRDNAKYCSAECKRRAYSARARAALGPRICQADGCGQDISDRQPHARYCSVRCRDRAAVARAKTARLHEWKPRACQGCGVELPPKRDGIGRLSRASYCSATCYNRALTVQRRRDAGPRTCQADGCGQDISGRNLHTQYCSVKCRDRAKRARTPECAWPDCGRSAVGHSGLRVYCQVHHNRARTGGDMNAPIRRSRAAVGERRENEDGYVQIRTATGWQLEHRLVMEHALGRPLYDHENVHHVNGDRGDNRVGNLELWTRSQPPGKRVTDMLAWMRGFLAQYEGAQIPMEEQR